MANDELPESPADAEAPEQPPLATVDSSRPAAAGRHDIVEDADPEFFWPEVDGLLTIDFSRELENLPQAGDSLIGAGSGGWDPSLIPVPRETVDASPAEAPPGAADGSSEGSADSSSAASPDGAYGSTERRSFDPAQTVMAPEPGGRPTTSAPTSVLLGDAPAPEAPPRFEGTLLTGPSDDAGQGAGRGMDPLLAPVPVSKPVDFDFFREATGNQIQSDGLDFRPVNGGVDPHLLGQRPRPAPLPATGLGRFDVIKDILDRRLFTTALATTVALVLGAVGWIAVGARSDGNRSEANLSSTTSVDTTVEVDIEADIGARESLLPPTTFALTTSTATNTTVAPTRPRPTRSPTTAGATTEAPTTRRPATTAPPTTAATTAPPTTAATTAPPTTATTAATTTTVPPTTTATTPTTAATTTTTAATTTSDTKPPDPES